MHIVREWEAHAARLQLLRAYGDGDEGSDALGSLGGSAGGGGRLESVQTAVQRQFGTRTVQVRSAQNNAHPSQKYNNVTFSLRLFISNHDGPLEDNQPQYGDLSEKVLDSNIAGISDHRGIGFLRPGETPAPRGRNVGTLSDQRRPSISGYVRIRS